MHVYYNSVDELWNKYTGYQGYGQQIATEVNDMILHSMTLPGGRLNKKDGLTRYGDSHVKDKTS